MIDYYELLGVPRDATEMEIRSAYGRAALHLTEGSGSSLDGSILKQALLTLTDPALRATYDANLPVQSTTTAAPIIQGDEVFKYALRGALWFAGGCLVTAATYAAAADAGGKFFIAWGAVLFGGIQLFRGLAAYVRPGVAKTQSQILSLTALVALGVISGGWVLNAQAQGAQDAAIIPQWNVAMDSVTKLTDEADALMKQVLGRRGWVPQDAIDLRRVSSLYSQAGDVLAKAPVVKGHEWFRDGVVADFREAAIVASAMSALNASSSQAQWDGLGKRWSAMAADYNQLNVRFDAQRRR